MLLLPEPPQPILPPPPIPPVLSSIFLDSNLIINAIDVSKNQLIYSKFLQYYIFKFTNRNLHKTCTKLTLNDLGYLYQRKYPSLTNSTLRNQFSILNSTEISQIYKNTSNFSIFDDLKFDFNFNFDANKYITKMYSNPIKFFLDTLLVPTLAILILILVILFGILSKK